ncbi:MAG: hypothetical protein M3R24_38825, partial [Chloroflexota bacterium]|nr:hypothetical protein [Chloroflexota bacterium]
MFRRMSATTLRDDTPPVARTLTITLLAVMLVVSTLASLPFASQSFMRGAAAASETSVKQALFYD